MLSEPLPPEALAVALTTLCETPEAEKPTEPPELTLVDVVAITLSSTIASASAAPTAALPPAALPLASVETVDVWSAPTRTAPEAESPPVSAPRDACVSSSIRLRATTGVTETPPAEPWSDSVVAACVAAASSVTAPPSESDDPSAASACERVATMFKAIDAPTRPCPRSPRPPPAAPEPQNWSDRPTAA